MCGGGVDGTEAHSPNPPPPPWSVGVLRGGGGFLGEEETEASEGGGGGCHKGLNGLLFFVRGAANTFNSIERVYSRAIAFSNRRCSVPLESMLPTS